MPTFERFPLPDAGEGLTEADIVTWHVAVGDRVAINQPLVEIETAKSLVELPCPFDGIVTQLLASEGDTVEVGVPIVEVDVDPDGLAPAPEIEPEATREDFPSNPYTPTIAPDAPTVARASVLFAAASPPVTQPQVEDRG